MVTDRVLRAAIVLSYIRWIAGRGGTGTHNVAVAAFVLRGSEAQSFIVRMIFPTFRLDSMRRCASAA